MRDVVICEPVRTAVGGFGGAFKTVHAHEMASHVIRELMVKTKLPAEAVEDCIFAQCYPTMEAPAFGRMVALDAGLTTSTGGYQIDRRCGSGLQAVINAVMQVATGANDVVIAGGAESMSNAPFFSIDMRWNIKGDGLMLHDGLSRGRYTAGGKNHPVPGGMIETAENLRRDYQITRDAQDQFAYNSHMKAAAAQKSGKFSEEIIPYTVKGRKADTVVDQDEHIRPDSSLEKLSTLRAIRGKVDDQSTVTAGNASGQNDGAAACIVCTREAAEKYGLKPLGRLVSWSVAGVGPEVMGIGPVPSSQKALKTAGLELKDVDVIELNEAFAAQVLACTKALEFSEDDMERLNVNGSGISLGHPVGATGVRILTTMLREMERREARYGLETMCIGGGQGLAAVFERVS
ncbi:MULTISPECIES: acetyl-CoA C-acetyltransferase [unclassified Hyphomonas]|jgi:acetyl-CoA C-acetyltransferase|uniref:Acetyl-CoA acetyltransferase n=1 Tax=hydrothermal vent metagenome TaxID=652676 RepID=A0A170PSR5_9ZZZZ|nr:MULTISPECIES: acetyl-CoA C-acetyltransferase [unclassified Hyphomonas]MAL42974.1 acetyl-CoA C-acyltransferase [Hyphomonas sp.]MAX83470.1 acetyl-CoA C-acyltransferase [Hyphomonas sp.]MDF1805639.1 acetyl-CoA C-acetyltransferase [Hyphomonas sp.]HAO35793.1 acetyl-CoA C-acyltransferase [Hyphomonas sp.]HAW54433.1 acetyl-CoA C-acyltransferase [Hyphomonas sp.]|tara:strand:+ start:3910 stop:5121 length:1212 start_codon:yes stop_codon:yes gene_type:complete